MSKNEMPRNKDKDSVNPFEEEFNSDDVVNKNDEDDNNYSDSKNENESDFDLDNLLNYDEEDRKSDSFESLYEDSYFTRSETERLSSNFKDFLELPRIAQGKPSKTKGNHIPSENLIIRKDKIEITDENLGNDKRSTVLINRNEVGEIVGIEVLCTCGEKTIIKLEYEDDDQDTPNDSKSIHSETHKPKQDDPLKKDDK